MLRNEGWRYDPPIMSTEAGWIRLLAAESMMLMRSGERKKENCRNRKVGDVAKV